MTRRQDARPAYSRDGTVYAFWRETIERFGSIYGDDCRPLLIDARESLRIDSPADWDDGRAAARGRCDEPVSRRGRLPACRDCVRRGVSA